MSAKENLTLTPVAEYLKLKYLHDNEGGMTQQQLAEFIGVTRQTINNIVTRNRPLSSDLAIKLGEATIIDEDVDFWLKLKNANREFINDIHNDIALSKKKKDFFVQLERLGAHPLVDHEIRKAVEYKIIEISNFNENCIQPVSYDLQMGNVAIVSSDKKDIKVDLTEKDLIIRPKETAVVRSLESIGLSNKFFCRVGVKTSLVRNAIFISHGIHVDPGWKGELYFTLMNAGNEAFSLELRQPFMTIEINYLAQMSSGYTGTDINRKDFTSEEKKAITKTNSIDQELLKELENTIKKYYNK